MDTWDIQRYHLTTHNLFYSALFGERDTGLVDIGYQMVGEFMRLNDPRTKTLIEPCYTVFDGESVVFFDLLEPGEITDEEIERIAGYNQINLEAVEKHLKRVDITESNLDPNNVETFDHCVVCRSEQIEQHSNGSGRKRRQLDRLLQESCVIQVSPGDCLELVDGNSLYPNNIDQRLSEGIDVPQQTSKTIYLPRNIKEETLTVAVCEEVALGSDLRDNGIEIGHSDIRNHFGRDVSYDQLDETFRYLRDVGACRKRNGKFVFTKYNLQELMEVRHNLRETTIQTHFEGEDQMGAQQTLDDVLGNGS